MHSETGDADAALAGRSSTDAAADAAFEDTPIAAATGACVPPSRWHALLRALVAPVAVTLFGLAPFLLLPTLDGEDRALVWVEGDAATLARVESGIATESAFAGGTRRDAAARPSGCPAGALQLHFEIRRTDEAQTAREALERVARDAGARICASHRFELGRRDDTAAWWPLAASLVLPLGALFALRGVPFDAPPPSPRVAPETVVAGLAVALLAAVFAVPPTGATGGVATAIGLALATLPPVIHEVAFRGWMIPRLLPAFGATGAGLLSVAAGVVASAAGGPAVASAALIGTACAGVYLATRSLAACIAVHLLLATLGRVIAG
jgi:membrane protease YdiL (CAAX protease family)